MSREEDGIEGEYVLMGRCTSLHELCETDEGGQ